MTDGLDWLYAPVLRGMCKAESLYDGTLDICQVAEMNDAISVDIENSNRANLAARRGN